MEDIFYRYRFLYLNLPTSIRNLIGFIISVVPYRIRYGYFYTQYLSRIKTKFRNDFSFQEKAHWELLRDNVNYAIDTIPYYKSFRRITDIDSFRELPIINKEIISNNFTKFENRLLLNKAVKANTGGSSGTPLTFYLHQGITRAKERAHFDHYWSKYGFRRGERIVRMRGKGLRGDVLWEYDQLENSLSINTNKINEDNILEIHEKLESFEAKYLHGYPSSVLNFVSEVKRCSSNNLRNLNFDAVFLGSEALSESELVSLRSWFGCDIVHWYGHSECCIFAERISDSGDFKFSSPYGYCELVDEDDNPILEPGKIGRIIATSFDNKVMPLIRYDTGDLGELTVPASDFLGDIVLRKIFGRDKYFIYLSDGTPVSLTFVLFGQHYSLFTSVKEIQVTQNELGKIEIGVVLHEEIGIPDRNLFNVEFRQCFPVGLLDYELIEINTCLKTVQGKHILLIQNVQKDLLD